LLSPPRPQRPPRPRHPWPGGGDELWPPPPQLPPRLPPCPRPSWCPSRPPLAPVPPAILSQLRLLLAHTKNYTHRENKPEIASYYSLYSNLIDAYSLLLLTLFMQIYVMLIRGQR
jgi:hypothetical protein